MLLNSKEQSKTQESDDEEDDSLNNIILQDFSEGDLEKLKSDSLVLSNESIKYLMMNSKSPSQEILKAGLLEVILKEIDILEIDLQDKFDFFFPEKVREILENSQN
jgi:hypothetical protein